MEEEKRIRTTLKAVGAWADGKEGVFCVLEVGTHSRWVSEQLEKRGHGGVVANARHLRMIYGRDTKTDKTDAEVLARVARLDPTLLHAVQHRGKKAHRDLAVVKSRNALVETRTKLANHVRGILKSWGVRLLACSPDNLWHEEYAMEIPKHLRPALLPVLKIIAALSARIKSYEEEIKRLGEEEYPETKRVQQIDGLGPITSLAFVLTIEDPWRFRKARSVGAFLGMVPKVDQSGKQERRLGITKAGDPYLRKLLVQCAPHILGPYGRASDLRW